MARSRRRSVLPPGVLTSQSFFPVPRRIHRYSHALPGAGIAGGWLLPSRRGTILPATGRVFQQAFQPLVVQIEHTSLAPRGRRWLASVALTSRGEEAAQVLPVVEVRGLKYESAIDPSPNHVPVSSAVRYNLIL